MRIVVLDIDGVLVPTHQSQVARDGYGPLFDTAAVAHLETLCREADAQVVVSSAWRLDRMPDWTPEKGLRQMQRLFRDRCVDVDIIGVTPDVAQLIDSGPLAGLLWEAAERGHEIQAWLDEHPAVTGYVILDDHADMLPTQKRHFVQTKARVGFSRADLEMALCAIRRPCRILAE